MKAAFYTLGCKANQYETQALRERLLAAGYEIVPHTQDADVYLVNSCTVTAHSDQKTRQAVRRFKREHPAAAVVLTGCMPQAYPEAARQLVQADIILGNRDPARLVELLDTYFLTGERLFRVRPHETGEAYGTPAISGFEERTRAFVKIEDGCNRYCSYCIIPTARGRVRSKPLDVLREELTRLAEAGFLEIVLVGINLSAYGQDNGDAFCDAVELACSIDGVRRVRLGSLEPDHLDAASIRRLASLEKLCPQFHISLQSGCDATLKRMNRHYTTAEYEAICTSLRDHFPNAALTTDVMVGFAGETQEEFEESLVFVQKIGFSKVHVFPYSVRPGTKAENLPGQVPKAEKEARAHQMQEAADALRRAFLAAQCGRTEAVLLETRTADGFLEGYTANYTPVLVRADAALRGTIQPIRITGQFEDWCIGELAVSLTNR